MHDIGKFLLAEKYFKELNYQKAIENYKICIKEKIQEKQSYLNCAVCLVRIDKNEEAIILLSEIIVLYPDFEEAYQNRQLIYNEMNMLNLASKDMNEKIKLRGSRSNYNTRGKIHFKLGNYQKAIEDYTKVIELGLKYEVKKGKKIIKKTEENRNVIFAYINRAVTKAILKDYLGGLEDYKEAIDCGGIELFDLNGFYSNKGRMEEELGKIGDALYSYRRSNSRSGRYRTGIILINKINNSQDKKEQKGYFKDLIDKKLFTIIEIYNQLVKINQEKKLMDEKELFTKINIEMKDILKKENKVENFGTLYMYSSDVTFWKNKKEYGYTIEDLIKNRIYKKDSKLFNDPFDPYLKKYVNNFSENFEIFRMTCLTKIENNLLMWAHYANNHKGICVGYEIKIDSDILLKKIKYTGMEIKRKNSEDIFENMEKILTLEDSFFIKHKNWSYENEYRIVHLDSSTLYYNNVVVKEIIFGLECLEDNKLKIFNILKEKNIKFYEMEVGEDLNLVKNKFIRRN